MPRFGHGYGASAFAADKANAPAGPVILTDRQLDIVTAGAATLRLDLSAAAQGSVGTSTAAGSVQSVNAPILRVELNPFPRSLGTVPASLFLAAGQSRASGDSPQCSAAVETSGQFAALIEAALRTTTPASPPSALAVTCACAAFGIALNTP